MKRSWITMVMVLAVAVQPQLALANGLQEDVEQAVAILESFKQMPEKAIPREVAPQAAVYTYSRSQGLFAGVSLEGTVIAVRHDANEPYYRRKVTPAEILFSGEVKPPPSAHKLIQKLSTY